MEYYLAEFRGACYPIEWFIDSEEELTNKDFLCQVCLNVYKDPLQDKEGHMFGKDCITTWVKQNQNCPLSKIPLKMSDLCPNKRVTNQIGKLKIKCCNVNCQWIGQFNKLDEHLKSECEFFRSNCKFSGCQEKVIQKLEEDHYKQCNYRFIECPLNAECAPIQQNKLVDHLDEQKEAHQKQFNQLIQIIPISHVSSINSVIKLYKQGTVLKANYKCGKCSGPLTFLNRRENYHCFEFNCDVCKDSLNYYSFRCNPCDYDSCLYCNERLVSKCVCPNCPMEKLKSINSQKCQVCTKQASECYKCPRCEFALCKQCRSFLL